MPLPNNCCSLATTAVMHLARRFLVAIPQDKCDASQKEVLDYTLTPQSDFPEIDKEGRPAYANHELCTYWQTIDISKMKTLSGTARFPYLCKLSKCLLALHIPVSNAETEKVFSMVRKIITDYCTHADGPDRPLCFDFMSTEY